ncbi:MAG: hypothetical protein EPO26_12680 [Chloroflexota bacterium]|nr:MAG: hypothetical protein EPO26_12680 [Chloroflexota bacterium]
MTEREGTYPTCPPTLDLLEYLEGRIDSLGSAAAENHIATCPVCADALRRMSEGTHQPAPYLGTQRPEVPDDIRRVSGIRAARFREALSSPQPSVACFADVWSTRVSERSGGQVDDPDLVPRLVVVLVAEGKSYGSFGRAINVAPVSTETDYCSDLDLLVGEFESSLPFPFMVEVWNEVPMLSTQLNRKVGALAESLKPALTLAYEAHVGAQVDLTGLVGRVGPAMVGRDDPRLEFQERDSDACGYLRQPLLRLALGGPATQGRQAEAAPEARSARREFADTAPPGDEAAAIEAGSSDGERFVLVSGTALRRARQRRHLQVGEVAALLTKTGYPFNAKQVFDLERDSAAQLERSVAEAIARTLAVGVEDIRSGTQIGRQERFMALLRRPRIMARIEERARSTGNQMRQLQNSLAAAMMAAPLRSRGEMTDDEWEGWVLEHMESWSP